MVATESAVAFAQQEAAKERISSAGMLWATSRECRRTWRTHLRASSKPLHFPTTGSWPRLHAPPLPHGAAFIFPLPPVTSHVTDLATFGEDRPDAPGVVCRVSACLADVTPRSPAHIAHLALHSSLLCLLYLAHPLIPHQTSIKTLSDRSFDSIRQVTPSISTALKNLPVPPRCRLSSWVRSTRSSSRRRSLT
jgi:hypothetical protein